MNDEDNDFALFRASMKDVRPLKSDGRAQLTDTKPQPHPLPQQPSPDPIPDTLSDIERETPVSGEDALHFRRPGVQGKAFRRLQRGVLVDAKLDLHGMGALEAKRTVLQFLHWATEERLRVVCIIHGKGYHSNNPPVLKNKMNTWLRQHDQVLAFCSATAKHGGRGAVYVLLRAPKTR